MNLKLKFPFWYFEHCSVYRKDGEVIIKSEEHEIKIPFDGIGFLLLGPGCNISSNVLSHMNKNRIHVAISTSTQKPTCVISSCGIYGSGKWAFIQAQITANERKRLNAAKKLMVTKYPNLSQKIKEAKGVRELQGIEGPAMKKIYQKVFGYSFKRVHSEEGEPTTNTNYKINVANNMLYSLIQVICVEYGLSPHLSLIHGRKRNSFIYDLSDLFKDEEYYNKIKKSNNIKDVLITLSEYFYDQKIFHKLEEVLKSVFNYSEGEQISKRRMEDTELYSNSKSFEEY